MLKPIAISLLFVAAGAVAQQIPPIGEHVNINLVLLDAVVTDKQGNQILGLDKDDFVVKENGVEQKVDSIDYFTNRKLVDAPESKAPFKAEQVHDQRYFVFFFDKPEGPAPLFDRLNLARKSVKDFIKDDMKDTDFVAVVADDNARLKVYSDFTNDRQQLIKAVDQTSAWGRGLLQSNVPEGVPSLLRGGSDRLMDETGTVYEALNFVGDQLHSVKAKKTIVLFSIGIVAPDDTVQNGMIVSTSRYYEPMIRSLNQSNVTVYPISLLDYANMQPVFHQSLSRIAQETNGEYFQFNTSFAPALKQIEKQSAGYYMIGYYTKARTGSGYQKVSVSLKNPEFRVKARQGYAYSE
jgi:VWFA-related protein